uniref:Uncharacterized protein n=1 Tax=uncultured bacterium contig00036 TaxID=1181524 RepID=A0A806K0D1_9BACT|nr:hypothetical protein [uncultured bacterium contig00036]
MFYNSVVIALLLAFISFRSFWLEMRVNIGMLIPVYAAIVFVIFFFVSKNMRNFGGRYKMFTAINLLVSGIASTLILGAQSMGVVPAAIIREGLKITHTKILYINIALGMFLACGLLIILMQKACNENY